MKIAPIIAAALALASSASAQQLYTYTGSAQASTNTFSGIGTNAPNAELEIARGTDGGTAPVFRLTTSFSQGNSIDFNPFISGVSNGGFELSIAGTRRLVIDPSGNLGIGTVTPAALQHNHQSVVGSANAGQPGGGIMFTRYFSGSDYRGSAIFHSFSSPLSNDKEYLAFAVSSASSGSPYQSSKVKMVVAEDGNVGIGTTDPTSFGAGAVVTEIKGSTGYGALLTSSSNVTAQLFACEGQSNVYMGSRTNHPVLLTTGNVERMRLDTSGNVGIGTTNPQSKLAVNGTITTKEVVVTTTGWADYVFADNYNLAPLFEVEQQIKTDKHLPGIPSAADVAKTGISLGDMQAKLLAKIEELTLHLIDQQKTIAAQNKRLEQLESALSQK